MGVSVIKEKKAMNKMLSLINDSKYKDIILKNDNILKCFLYSKLEKTTGKVQN